MKQKRNERKYVSTEYTPQVNVDAYVSVYCYDIRWIFIVYHNKKNI